MYMCTCAGMDRSMVCELNAIIDIVEPVVSMM